MDVTAAASTALGLQVVMLQTLVQKGVLSPSDAHDIAQTTINKFQGAERDQVQAAIRAFAPGLVTGA